MSPSRYDLWKTTPPEPSRAACASCGEMTYEIRDRGDRPYGYSTDGEHPVCDARCAMFDALEFGTRTQRLATLKTAVEEDADLPVLEFLTSGPRIGQLTPIIGAAFYGGDTMMLVNDENDDEHVVPWSSVVDVKRLWPDSA